MKTIVVIVGTVPEAVKLGPVCRALVEHKNVILTRVILSGQHRDRVAEILNLFGIHPDEDLGDQIQKRDLATMASAILDSLAAALRRLKPDLVVVQGDTTTAFMAALAAFYEGVPVGHVEAGLTTGNVERPFPEELHRDAIGKTATLLFAPSARATTHARRIARPTASVFFTGNPCVDALLQFTNDMESNGRSERSPRKKILVTVHRRENYADRGQAIGQAIRAVADDRPDAEIVFVQHNHPALSALTNTLQQARRLTVLPAQGYRAWLQLLHDCYFVVSDSGGAQEEAPWLKKPLLVLRDETERPEVVEAGAAKLVGSDAEAIYRAAVKLLDDEDAYRRMQLERWQYPYGDGNAAAHIVKHMLLWLNAARREGNDDCRSTRVATPLHFNEADASSEYRRNWTYEPDDGFVNV